MNFNSNWKCNWNDKDSNITENDIENIIDYINEQLTKNRTMKDIEVNDFGVNERGIRKRLDRRGYKKIDGVYEGLAEVGRDREYCRGITCEITIDRAL